jgi:hypothetical protein
MKRYVAEFNDGRVEEIAAEGLLETATYYMLFRPYRQDRNWAQDVVAVYAKTELSERPHAVGDDHDPPRREQQAA